MEYGKRRLLATAAVLGLILGGITSAYADADQNSFGGARGQLSQPQHSFGGNRVPQSTCVGGCYTGGFLGFLGWLATGPGSSNSPSSGYGDGAYVSPFGSGAVGNVAPPNGGKM